MLPLSWIYWTQHGSNTLSRKRRQACEYLQNSYNQSTSVSSLQVMTKSSLTIIGLFNKPKQRRSEYNDWRKDNRRSISERTRETSSHLFLAVDLFHSDGGADGRTAMESTRISSSARHRHPESHLDRALLASLVFFCPPSTSMNFTVGTVNRNATIQPSTSTSITKPSLSIVQKNILPNLQRLAGCVAL